MTKEFAYYETYPKVHPVGRPSHVTIRPLGKHAAFDPERTYVCLLYTSSLQTTTEPPIMQLSASMPVPSGSTCPMAHR